MNRRDEVPSADMLLCEYCGYILSNIPTSHLCPECGKPIADSLPSNRKPPRWETSMGVGVFVGTTSNLILHPLKYFKTLTPYGDNKRSRKFAWIHIALASLLFTLCMLIQLRWILLMFSLAEVREFFSGWLAEYWMGSFLLIVAFPMYFLTILFFWTLNAITVVMTAWESKYRGFRLPKPVVERALHYHTARYFPVALIALATVATFHILLGLRIVTEEQSPRYLYILSSEVLIGAGYLFGNYVAAMFKLMRANSPQAR